MARIGRANIMLEPEIEEKFKEIAKSMGLTVSALGAFVIGQYVRQQSSIVDPMIDFAKGLMTEEIKGAKRSES